MRVGEKNQSNIQSEQKGITDKSPRKSEIGVTEGQWRKNKKIRQTRKGACSRNTEEKNV